MLLKACLNLSLEKINLKVNKFAKLCPIPQLSGQKARFYSIQIEGKETHEAEDFFERHEGQEHLQEPLNEIWDWIGGIAHDIGALDIMFRHEGKASALPPDNSIRKRWRNRVQVRYQESNRLRLYLIRLNEHVVILLNGGEKTDRDPRKCPNVKQYFIQAQAIAKALDEALDIGDITYNPTKTDIIIQPEFEIQIP